MSEFGLTVNESIVLDVDSTFEGAYGHDGTSSFSKDPSYSILL